MPNRSFEMHQYRQVIVRMRLGDTDRGVANLGLMGRKKAAEVRSLAQRHGWSDLDQPLPEEEVLAQVLSSSTARPQIPSLVLPHREDVQQSRQDGIRGNAIRHGHFTAPRPRCHSRRPGLTGAAETAVFPLASGALPSYAKAAGRSGDHLVGLGASACAPPRAGSAPESPNRGTAIRVPVARDLPANDTSSCGSTPAAAAEPRFGCRAMAARQTEEPIDGRRRSHRE